MNDVLQPRQWILPVTLAGRFARLEPLAIEHVAPLQQAVQDGELWKLWFTSIPRPEAMPDYVEQALRAREAGSAMPFVVKNALGEVVGSTRFGHVDADNRRVEIGWTWYAARAQRTALNTECKQLCRSKY